jgi:hypothetical protein
MVRFSDLLGGGAHKDKNSSEGEQRPHAPEAAADAPAANDPYAELAMLGADVQPAHRETVDSGATPSNLSPEEILARLTEYAESMRDRQAEPRLPPPPPSVDLTRLVGDDLLPNAGDGGRTSG